VGTAILITLTVVGVGIVISQLVRMRDWLKRAPPPPDVGASDGEQGDPDDGTSGNGVSWTII
jgi:hypothetical protein